MRIPARSLASAPRDTDRQSQGRLARMSAVYDSDELVEVLLPRAGAAVGVLRGEHALATAEELEGQLDGLLDGNDGGEKHQPPDILRNARIGRKYGRPRPGHGPAGSARRGPGMTKGPQMQAFCGWS